MELSYGDENQFGVDGVIEFLSKQKNLRSLAFKTRYVDVSILDVIANYTCLDTLCFYHLPMHESMFSKMRKLFSTLKTLEFRSGDPENLINSNQNLFSNCRQLHSLVVPLNYLGTSRITDFPQLESLQICSVDRSENEDNIDISYPSPLDFLRDPQTNTLKKIHIDWEARYKRTYAELFEIILREYSQIETLQVNGINFKRIHHCLALATFDNIKILKLYFDPHFNDRNSYNADGALNFMRTINSIDTLEHFELFNVVTNNDYIPVIAEFKNLRHLQLCNGAEFHFPACSQLDLKALGGLQHLAVLNLEGKLSYKGTDLIYLVAKLKNLKVLYSSLVNITIYNRILEIVRDSQRSITIYTNPWKRREPHRTLYIERSVESG